jgi:hypothetical protein
MTPNSNEFSVNEATLRLPLVDPKIIVSKSRRRLMLYSNNELVRLYRIGLGEDPVSDKAIEGDRRTPEGIFYVFTKNEQSSFYLSLGLSYPNIEDAERGLREGLITQAESDQIIDAIHHKIEPPQKLRWAVRSIFMETVHKPTGRGVVWRWTTKTCLNYSMPCR